MAQLPNGSVSQDISSRHVDARTSAPVGLLALSRRCRHAARHSDRLSLRGGRAERLSQGGPAIAGVVAAPARESEGVWVRVEYAGTNQNNRTSGGEISCEISQQSPAVGISGWGRASPIIWRV